jgi:hypothetical protein
LRGGCGSRAAALERELESRRDAEILRVAEQEESDLIVLAPHSIDPARPGGGLGTQSHQIALLAPCEVLLVR